MELDQNGVYPEWDNEEFCREVFCLFVFVFILWNRKHVCQPQHTQKKAQEKTSGNQFLAIHFVRGGSSVACDTLLPTPG